MQLIFFFFATLWFRHRLKSGKRWRYLNFILAYYSFLFFLFSFTGKGRLKGTRIRYESSSLKNIFHFFCHSIFYFHFFFYYIGGNELGKSEKLRPTIIRGKTRNPRRRDERKYRSYVVHRPVIFLWRRCIRYRMWILTEKVVAHLTAPAIDRYFWRCRNRGKTRGIIKNWKIIPRAIIYFSFLLVVSSYFIFRYQEILVLIEQFQ